MRKTRPRLLFGEGPGAPQAVVAALGSVGRIVQMKRIRLMTALRVIGWAAWAGLGEFLS